MIFAETERLVLRSLDKDDLPRIVELIGDWDVAQWLVSVPYPYSLKNAEEFYAKTANDSHGGATKYFLLQRKSDGKQVGAIGLHPPREPMPEPGELVIGYWLGKEFWGQGLMDEALRAVIALAFKRAEVAAITATADPANHASQKVLRKAGFIYQGIAPRPNGPALRGSSEVTRWQLTREDNEKKVDFP
jgi:RimJ/RimL family protein N-acetyltransferase